MADERTVFTWSHYHYVQGGHGHVYSQHHFRLGMLFTLRKRQVGDGKSSISLSVRYAALIGTWCREQQELYTPFVIII